jgi:hypothetical protein
MKWLKSKRGTTTHLLNVTTVVRFEGVLEGPAGPERKAVLRAFVEDIDGKEYAVVFSTTDLPLGGRVLDDLILFLANAETNGVYDVEARALALTV